MKTNELDPYEAAHNEIIIEIFSRHIVFCRVSACVSETYVLLFQFDVCACVHCACVRASVRPDLSGP